MLLALSYVTYVFIGWFKFLLLKFLYEYWPLVFTSDKWQTYEPKIDKQVVCCHTSVISFNTFLKIMTLNSVKTRDFKMVTHFIFVLKM